MKARLRVWPMKAVAALCLAAGLFPLSVLLGRYFAPEEAILWWAPIAAAYLWGIGGYLLPQKARLPVAVLGCALLVAWGIITQMPLGITRLLLLLPCLALLLVLPPAWSRPVWDEWSSGAWLGGLIVHLFAQTAATRPPFSGAMSYLLAVFAVYVFLFILSLNRHSLRDGMHGAEKAPAALRRRNGALVTVFFLASALIACWGKLAEWLNTAFQYTVLAVAYVINFIMSLLPVRQMGAGGGGGDLGGMLGAEEAGEPSAFAVLMEKVFMVLAAILLLALVLLALWAMGKGIRRLWKRFMAYLRRYAGETGEDYVDEAESILNWDERAQSIRNQLQNAFKRAPKPPRWESMTGRERVRFLYRQFLKRKPDAKMKTAREALSQDAEYTQPQANAFIQAYERARYSDEDISAQEADKLRKTIKA